MDFLNSSSTLSIIEYSTAVAGVFASLYKIFKDIKKAKKEAANKILNEAKDYDLALKNRLEARIDKLQSELDNLELNVKKDLSNIKDSHAIELKNLSDRIEMLRDDLKDQHSQILNLLTKLVG